MGTAIAPNYDAGGIDLCPYCRTAIRPMPTRACLCPHCQGQVYPRAGLLLTSEQSEVFDARAQPQAAAPNRMITNVVTNVVIASNEPTGLAGCIWTCAKIITCIFIFVFALNIGLALMRP